MPEEKEMEAPKYPEEFDSKSFLEFVRERFGSPIMAEEELLLRFTSFISPVRERGEEVSEEDITQWYNGLLKEIDARERPLDVSGNLDISDPHAQRKPTLERRLADQEREVSLASGLLQSQHAPGKPADKRPRSPRMGE